MAADRQASCGDACRRRLLRAAQRGDRRARAGLVDAHLPLVRAIAAGYRDCGLPFDDLAQEGAIGLLDAIDRFDLRRGSTFDAFARFRIRRAIRDALSDQSRLIRLPRHIVEHRRAIERAEARLLAAGAEPTSEAIAVATGLSEAAVRAARGAPFASCTVAESLACNGAFDAGAPPDGSSDDPVTAVLEHERAAGLGRALTHLPNRQRAIVVAHWGLDGGAPQNLSELARHLQLSPRRVQTLVQDAMATLQDDLVPLSR